MPGQANTQFDEQSRKSGYDPENVLLRIIGRFPDQSTLMAGGAPGIHTPAVPFAAAARAGRTSATVASQAFLFQAIRVGQFSVQIPGQYWLQIDKGSNRSFKSTRGRTEVSDIFGSTPVSS